MVQDKGGKWLGGQVRLLCCWGKLGGLGLALLRLLLENGRVSRADRIENIRDESRGRRGEHARRECACGEGH